MKIRFSTNESSIGSAGRPEVAIQVLAPPNLDRSPTTLIGLREDYSI